MERSRKEVLFFLLTLSHIIMVQFKATLNAKKLKLEGPIFHWTMIIGERVNMKTWTCRFVPSKEMGRLYSISIVFMSFLTWWPVAKNGWQAPSQLLNSLPKRGSFRSQWGPSFQGQWPPGLLHSWGPGIPINLPVLLGRGATPKLYPSRIFGFPGFVGNTLIIV